MLPVLLPALLLTTAAGPAPQSPDLPYTAARSDPVTYEVDFRAVVTAPQGTKTLRVWVPVPPTDRGQEVTGSAFTTFPGRTWDDFRRALAARTTRAYGRFWSAAEVRPIAVKQTARAWFVTPTTKIRRTLARRQGRELETPADGAV